MMDGNIISLADAERLQYKEAVHHLPTFTAFNLGTRTFPPIRFILPGYVPEGATILAGRPKLGPHGPGGGAR